MNITIIANGFQKGYIIDFINGLAVAIKNSHIRLIGSPIYDHEKLDNRICYERLGGETVAKSFLSKIIINIRRYFYLLSHINRKNTDVIHIQWLNLIFIDGIIIPLYFRLIGIRIVYTAHDVLPHSRENLLNRILFFVIYRLPDHIVVHTEFIKARIINEFGVLPQKITVVRHGLYSIPNDLELKKDNARKIMCIDPDDFVILFFGIITKYKGLKVLLDAFEKVEKVIANTRLIIAGKVDTKYQKEFEALLVNYQSDKVIIVSDYIEENKVQVYFKSADFTILPYLEASQSGVMFLSYTFGLPVIAPNLGGFPNDILEGRTGYLFNAGDSESLAEAIVKLFKKMEFKDSKTASFIRKYTLANYSWESTGLKLSQIYSNIY